MKYEMLCVWKAKPRVWKKHYLACIYKNKRWLCEEYFLLHYECLEILFVELSNLLSFSTHLNTMIDSDWLVCIHIFVFNCCSWVNAGNFRLLLHYDIIIVTENVVKLVSLCVCGDADGHCLIDWRCLMISHCLINFLWNIIGCCLIDCMDCVIDIC